LAPPAAAADDAPELAALAAFEAVDLALPEVTVAMEPDMTEVVIPVFMEDAADEADEDPVFLALAADELGLSEPRMTPEEMTVLTAQSAVLTPSA
jgi:hypothetical protein